MDKNKRLKAKSLLLDYISISFGMTIYVFSWVLFIIPAQITGGGISGLSVVIFYSTGFPIAISYIIINAFLLLIAVKYLGASFGIKTIYSIILTTVLFWITPGLIKEPIIKDAFLATLIGAIVGGSGIGIIFSRGGSSGGTDIIAMLINRKRNISPGRILMYCDIIIIGSSFFVFHSPEKLVYGYILMIAETYTIDAFLNGYKASAQLFIFSKRYEEIANFINKSPGRGVTILEGTGWYSKKNIKVIMTIVRRRESSVIFRKIKELDPNAFISMGSVTGVFGEGFDHLKL